MLKIFDPTQLVPNASILKSNNLFDIGSATHLLLSYLFKSNLWFIIISVNLCVMCFPCPFLSIKNRVLEMLPTGAGGRCAIGIVVLTHIIAYNETGASTAMFAACIAAFCAFFSGNWRKRKQRYNKEREEKPSIRLTQFNLRFFWILKCDVC